MKKSKITFLLLIGILPFFINGFYMPYIINNHVVFWIQDLFSFIVLPTIILCFGVKKNYFSLTDLGITFKVNNKADELIFIKTRGPTPNY